ncbi:efflux RND transporter periplasmic adaptor subunit [Hydrogenimonas urashimensis]|uniref:efflux RND transporter periplasmic adaptor subunit n=1 Tax=Hydrogenimonas urashimensis TaxID=2740515 RepID=UPI001915B91A|nr:efflux RND transporter periplasmic adaptor subunit [Hydrogenimonas urashimensis]
MLWNRLVIGGLGVLLLLGGCGKVETKEESVKTSPIKVRVHTLKAGSYPIWTYFTGKTEAVDAVDVVARVGGELREVHYTPGHTVKRGESLFQIDPSEYKAKYDRLLAVLEKDEASYRLAKVTFERYRPLVEDQLAPQAKLDELNASLHQYLSLLKADKAVLENAAIELGYCNVVAPIDGVAGQPEIVVGNFVKPGTVLTRIVKDGRLYVHFNPSFEEVALIRRYSESPLPPVRISLRGMIDLNATLNGRVDFIDSETDPETGTVAMRAIVDNPKRLVSPGAFVKVALFLGRKPSLIAVHPDQIFHDQKGQHVYVVDGSNRVHVRYVHPIFANSELVVVGKKELRPGERVVVDIPMALTDGLIVTPVETPNPVQVK